jgi:hypothetical protein
MPLTHNNKKGQERKESQEQAKVNESKRGQARRVSTDGWEDGNTTG